ncbi:MAG: hypothetical protein JW854_05120 [Actinobacteria bacterium]|nr:hypothetical protein [Actinomycetota bacterium]
MIKHIEDSGNVNFLVNDGGKALLMCSVCKRKWYVEIEPFEEAEDNRFLELKGQISENADLLMGLRMNAEELNL